VDDDDYDLAPQAPPTIPQGRTATRAPGATAAAASRAAGTSVSSGGGCHAVGDVIVASDGAVFPPRCIRCNAPGDGKPIRKRFAWNEDESGMSAARLIPVIGIIIATVWVSKRLATRQYVNITYSLCAKHRALRNMSYVVMVVFGLAAAGVFVHGMSLMNGPWMLAGLGLFIVAIVAGAKGLTTLKRGGMRRNSAELIGAGKAFRDSLPRPGMSRTR